MRAGRTERVGGGGYRLSRTGRDLGDSNLRTSLSRAVDVEVQVAIVSGRM